MVPPGVTRWSLALGLILGTLYALFMGPLRIADEGGHMYRTFLVSEGYCTAVPAIGVPMDYRDLDHRIFWKRLSKNTTGHDLLNMVNDTQGEGLPVVSLFFAVNLYSCVPYLPAGAAFRLGRIYTGNPLILMYLGRFANLFFYLLMLLIAMRLLPDFQLPLAVLALMPMSLHQAASLSADSVTNALSFVMTAYILRLSTAGADAPLRRSDYVLMAIGAVVSGLCKSNAGLLFLLVLIPGARFPSRRMRWLTVAGSIVLAYGTFGAWQIINRPNGEIHETLKIAAGIYPTENTAFIIGHPVRFLDNVLKTVVFMRHEYLVEFVGKLGWFDVPLPEWIPWLYMVLLIVLTAAYRAGPRLLPWQRIGLMAVFLINVGSLYVALWAKEAMRTAMATDAVLIAVSGRYVIPFALEPMLAAAGGFATRMRNQRIVIPALAVSAMATVVLVNAVALDIVWNRFQAHSSTFPNRLRMALTLNFTDNAQNAPLLYDNLVVSSRTPGESVFLVSDGVRHLVPNKATIASRGYRWPEDIRLLPPEELAAIPMGPPLQLSQDGRYEGKLVRRPGSGVEDAKVFVVLQGQKHWIPDGHWITAHGYKWPDDVNTIPASELDKIPQGDQVQ